MSYIDIQYHNSPSIAFCGDEIDYILECVKMLGSEFNSQWCLSFLIVKFSLFLIVVSSLQWS